MKIYFNNLGSFNTIKAQLESRKIFLDLNLVDNKILDFNFFKNTQLDALIFFIDGIESELFLKNIIKYCEKFKVKTFLITKNKNNLDQYYFFHHGVSLISSTEETSKFLNQFLLATGQKTSNHDSARFPIKEKLSVFSINYLESVSKSEFLLKTYIDSFSIKEFIQPIFKIESLKSIQNFVVESAEYKDDYKYLKLNPQFESNVLSIGKQITDVEKLENFIKEKSKEAIIFNNKIAIFSRTTLDLSKIRTKNILIFNEAKNLIKNLIDEVPEIIFYDLNGDPTIAKISLWKLKSLIEQVIGYNPLIALFNAPSVLDSENVFLKKDMQVVDINTILIKHNYNNKQNDSILIPELGQNCVYFPDEVKIASINSKQVTFFSQVKYLKGATFYIKDYNNFILKIENVKEIAGKVLYSANILGGDELDKIKIEKFMNAI